MKNFYETLSLFFSKFDPSKFKDAVNYIHEIKTQFSNKPDEYDSFGKTLFYITEARLSNDGDIVTLREIGEPDVERLRATLQGHRDLLAKFDSYLPQKYKNDHGEIKTENVLSGDEVRSLKKFSDKDCSNPSAEDEDKRKKRKNNSEEVPVCEIDANKTLKKIRTETQSFFRKVRNGLPKSSSMGVLKSLFQSSMDEVKKSVKKMEKKENNVGFSVELEECLKQCEKIVAEDTKQQGKKNKLDERFSVDEVRGQSSSPNHPYEWSGSMSSYWGKHKIDKKEEYLSNIEDDQLAQDLLIEWFKSAITYAKYLLKKDESEEKEVEEQNKKEIVEEHVGTFELRFNQCLYEIDKENMIKNSYLQNPEKALPLILAILR